MTAALIIASGRRSGKGPLQPGLRIGTISAIQRIVLLFQQAGIKEIVVCGEEEEVKRLAPAMDLVFLPCGADGEMLDNIQTGIAYLQEKARQIFVCHANVPLFSIGTVEALMAAMGTVCVPSHQGKLGHPILLRSSCYQDILDYRGEDGLRGAIRAGGFFRTIVEVQDMGIFPDNTQADQGSKILLDHDVGRLRLSYKLRIGREDIFYGPGIHQLLLLTEELHSLADACRHMGISYSKGRKIIRTMEEQMNCAVLTSQQGGRGGGYSQLTQQARDMARRYEDFVLEAEGTLKALFEKHFEDELI